MSLSDEQKAEILDWVRACQSAYHIDSTPGHRFGGLGSNLAENQEALLDYIEEVARAIERAATIAAMRRCAEICAHQWTRAGTADDCEYVIQEEIARLEAEK